MILSFNERILAHKLGDVTGDGVDDDIYLISSLDNRCEYRTYILIEEKSCGKTCKIELENENYKFDLSLESFIDNKKKEILVRSIVPYHGGYMRSNIFSWQAGEIVEVFNSDVFFENNKITAKYKENYRVEVLNLKINKKYIIDISENFKYYLDFVYYKNGNIKHGKERVNISRVYNSYAFYELGSNVANLKIYQKILGKSDADYIGDIESQIKWEKGDFHLIEQRVISVGNLINKNFRKNTEKNLEESRWGVKGVKDENLYSKYHNDLMKYYEESAEEKSSSPIYWYNLAKAQFIAGDLEEALKSINMYLTFVYPYYLSEKSILLKEKIERKLKNRIWNRRFIW